MKERAKLLRDAPGFRDVRLHRALLPESRFQLVNVAHWDSEEDWLAATRSNGQFRSSVAEAAQVATPNPARYEVVVEFARGAG